MRYCLGELSVSLTPITETFHLSESFGFVASMELNLDLTIPYPDVLRMFLESLWNMMRRSTSMVIASTSAGD